MTRAIARKNLIAIGQTIQELGSVPSGHLYAQLMAVMSLSEYQTLIDVLKQNDVIRETGGHELQWIG